MKWIFLLVIIAAVAVYFVYLRPPAQQPIAAQTPSAPASAPAAPSQASAIAPQPAIPEKHIAPKGTYFLLQAASITTDSGVVGIGVGTKVTVVNDKAKTWRVTDGQNQFDVPPANLTDDLDIAAAVIQKDADARAAYAAGIQSEQEKQESDRKAREQGAAWLARQLELQRQQILQQQQSTLRFQPGQAAQPVTTGTGGTPPPFGRPGP